MYANIQSGLRVLEQEHLDGKTVKNTLADLIDLGINSHLAFSYPKFLKVTLLDSGVEYVWRPEVVEDTTGVIPDGFIYPANSIANDIDYSGIKYNFFPITYEVADGGLLEVTIVPYDGATGIRLIEDVTTAPTEKVFGQKLLKSTDSSVEITTDGQVIDFKVTHPNPPDPISTYVTAGAAIEISGTGTVVDPFVVNSKNTQKIINSFPYVLLATDHMSTIFVDNPSIPIVIEIPDGLPTNFFCVLVQMGDGEVKAVTGGTAVLKVSPELYQIINGKNDWMVIERKLATQDYYISGRLSVI